MTTDLFSEAEFLSNVAQHEMTMISDDGGFYRHLRFANPQSNNQYFDLVTWPGHLCYTGDMGTFVFQRNNDMLEFFAASDYDQTFAERNGKTLYTNPGYWMEKVISVSGNQYHSSLTELDPEKIRAVVLEEKNRWLKDDSEAFPWSPEAIENLDNELDYQIFDCLGYGEPDQALIGMRDFDFTAPSGRKLDFGDTLMDVKFTRPTHEFLWACCAIAWGVKQYYADKEAHRETQKVSPGPKM